jgi:hypothetical protein
MCQNLLAFLKDNCPLSTTSIATSNALDVHLTHCVNLGTLFTLVGFFCLCKNCWWNVLIIGGLLVLQVTLSLARYNGHHGVNPLPFGTSL